MGNCIGPTESGGKNKNIQPPLPSPPIEVRKRSNEFIKAVILGQQGSGKTTLRTGTYPTADDKKL